MGLSGCATFKSLGVAAHLPLYERILIYSGTRLDWAAIAKNDLISKILQQSNNRRRRLNFYPLMRVDHDDEPYSIPAGLIDARVSQAVRHRSPM
jgi:hypothetical protein